jgi:hypothetical protein
MRSLNGLDIRLPFDRRSLSLEVHIDHYPYGPKLSVFVFRKIPEAGSRRSSVHLALVEEESKGVVQRATTC